MHVRTLISLFPFLITCSLVKLEAEPKPDPLALEYRDLQPLLARHAAPDRPWAVEPSLSQRDETALEYRDLQPLLARHAAPDRPWARDQSAHPIQQPLMPQRRGTGTNTGGGGGGASTTSSSINPVQQANLLPRNAHKSFNNEHPIIEADRRKEAHRGEGVMMWKGKGPMGPVGRSADPEAFAEAEVGGGHEGVLDLLARELGLGMDDVYGSGGVYRRAAVAEGGFGGGAYEGGFERRSGTGQEKGGNQGEKQQSGHGKTAKKLAGAGEEKDASGEGPSDPLIRSLAAKTVWTKHDYESFVARGMSPISRQNMEWWNKLDKKFKNGEIKKQGNWSYGAHENDPGGQGSGAL